MAGNASEGITVVKGGGKSSTSSVLGEELKSRCRELSRIPHNGQSWTIDFDGQEQSDKSKNRDLGYFLGVLGYNNGILWKPNSMSRQDRLRKYVDGEKSKRVPGGYQGVFFKGRRCW